LPSNSQDPRLVLIVEDSPDDEALMVRALRRTGIAMELVVMRDGAEALAYLAQCGAGCARTRRPDVVISDLKLPRVDGFELLRGIRADAHTAAIPVVMFSSSAQDADRHNAYNLGANSYIQKPVESQAFAEVLRHLGTYWLSLNEPPPRVATTAAA
jgi:CheY-like chemotaxis protein